MGELLSTILVPYPISRDIQRILCIALLMLTLQQAGWAVMPDQHQEMPKAMHLIGGDGMNLAITAQTSALLLEVKLTSSDANWFMGTFMNLPTERETTIELSLGTGGPKESPASVVKWYRLHPVMTYADPSRYESYEWFQKDASGRWVSGDPFKTGENRFAGSGKVPEQHVMPPRCAAPFLSADGRYWSAWRELDGTEAVMDKNIFRMTQQFALPSATVAIRMPYLPVYQHEFYTLLRRPTCRASPYMPSGKARKAGRSPWCSSKIRTPKHR